MAGTVGCLPARLGKRGKGAQLPQDESGSHLGRQPAVILRRWTGQAGLDEALT